MFGYAKEHEPCIIFMDEIDAIGGRRFSEGTSADREIQRTLMELLNQLDGFDYLGKTKIIMATNRPDTLDPALLRAGRLDRKIEIPLPNEVGRLEILKIHSSTVQLEGEIDFESVVKMSDGLNGADLRNVVTEAYVSVYPPLLLWLSNIYPVVCLQSRITGMESTKMTLTRLFERWRRRRSWRAIWNIRSCRGEGFTSRCIIRYFLFSDRSFECMDYYISVLVVTRKRIPPAPLNFSACQSATLQCCISRLSIQSLLSHFSYIRAFAASFQWSLHATASSPPVSLYNLKDNSHAQPLPNQSPHQLPLGHRHTRLGP